MLDLNNLSEICFANAEKRQKNGAGIKTDTYSMLKHCATEVVEATESYGYYFNEIPQLISDIDLNISDMQIKNKNVFSSELADIICCVLIIAAKENIDIEDAILDCIEKNQKRANKEGDKL